MAQVATSPSHCRMLASLAGLQLSSLALALGFSCMQKSQLFVTSVGGGGWGAPSVRAVLWWEGEPWGQSALLASLLLPPGPLHVRVSRVGVAAKVPAGF